MFEIPSDLVFLTSLYGGEAENRTPVPGISRSASNTAILDVRCGGTFLVPPCSSVPRLLNPACVSRSKGEFFLAYGFVVGKYFAQEWLGHLVLLSAERCYTKSKASFLPVVDFIYFDSDVTRLTLEK